MHIRKQSAAVIQLHRTDEHPQKTARAPETIYQVGMRRLEKLCGISAVVAVAVIFWAVVINLIS